MIISSCHLSLTLVLLKSSDAEWWKSLTDKSVKNRPIADHFLPNTEQYKKLTALKDWHYIFPKQMLFLSTLNPSIQILNGFQKSVTEIPI